MKIINKYLVLYILRKKLMNIKKGKIKNSAKFRRK